MCLTWPLTSSPDINPKDEQEDRLSSARTSFVAKWSTAAPPNSEKYELLMLESLVAMDAIEPNLE
jgi:hypothetical protein